MTSMPAALDRLRDVNLYFVVEHGPEHAGTGRPTSSLLDPAVATELFDHTAAAMGTGERRVAVSNVFFTYAAHLCAVAVGTAAHTGRSVDLHPERLHFDGPGNRFSLHLAEATPGGSPIDEILRQAEPLIDAWGRFVAPGALWGNVASSIISAGDQLGPIADGVVADTMRHPKLAAAVDDKTRRRRSCCLYYRCEPGGYCGDCSLTA